ncbi:VOC family protein [Flagellimonas marina]|uniref:VOC family protein n=1 Tax=Flagellimonas marina TaxID=1775168 RepID=A0ABV8PQ09_9FLAO
MKQIFINLPVKELQASQAFYRELGFSDYELFSGDNQKCMKWGDAVYVMLQSFTFFNSGNNKTIANPKNSRTASFTLPVDSVELLNHMVEKGIHAGGNEPTPIRDEGFMKVRTLEDLDDHSWSIIHLNMEKFLDIKNNK